MKHTRIGVVSQGIDGSDIYDRFDYDEETSASVPLNAAKSLYYQECRGPGSSFCTDFRVMPVQYSAGCSFITISSQRFDI